MKKRLSKIIIISIFLVLSFLLLGSKVNATINIDGTTYYTRDDIGWRGRLDKR